MDGARRKRLALSGGALLGALVLTELALRLFVPATRHFHFPTGRFPDIQFERHADWNQDLDGVSYHFDHDGFRVGSGQPGDKTVLFVGDSFTLGQRVDDASTFPRATERTLRNDGLRVRSRNAGISGFGAAQELRLLRRLLHRFPPDAVVIEAFPNDDLADNWADGGFGVQDGKLVPYDPPHIPRLLRARELLGDSLLARLALVRGIANAVVGPYTFAPRYDEDFFALEKALVAEMVASAQERKVPVLVVSVPAKWELQGDRTVPEHTADLDRYDRVVRDLKSLGVPFLDMRSVLSLKDSYIDNDGHLTVEGNARAGRAVAEGLKSLLAPSPASPASTGH